MNKLNEIQENMIEKYFDNGLILTRFTTFEDLKKKLRERLNNYGLEIRNYDFKFDFDNDFEDYSVIVEIYKDNEVKYDLQLYYAITRIGERIIVESDFVRY